MLSGDAGGVENLLKLGNVQPENSNTQGESDGREEKQVLGLLVKGWWVTEDRKSACSNGHKVEPLPVLF